MTKVARVVGLWVLVVAALGLSGQISRAAGKERFEVSGIKAVRPALVNTIAALKKGDVPKARAAFADYDSAGNGIEVYINTRDKEMYDDLEHHWQAKIEEGLMVSKPDTASLLFGCANDAWEIR